MEFSLKKEYSSICDNIYEPEWNYAKWNEPNAEGYYIILHNIIWGIWDSQTHRSIVWWLLGVVGKEKKGGINQSYKVSVTIGE